MKLSRQDLKTWTRRLAGRSEESLQYRTSLPILLAFAAFTTIWLGLSVQIWMTDGIGWKLAGVFCLLISILYGWIEVVLPLQVAREERVITADQMFTKAMLCAGNAALIALLTYCAKTAQKQNEVWLVFGTHQVLASVVVQVIYWGFLAVEIALGLAVIFEWWRKAR